MSDDSESSGPAMSMSDYVDEEGDGEMKSCQSAPDEPVRRKCSSHSIDDYELVDQLEDASADFDPRPNSAPKMEGKAGQDVADLLEDASKDIHERPSPARKCSDSKNAFCLVSSSDCQEGATGNAKDVDDLAASWEKTSDTESNASDFEDGCPQEKEKVESVESNPPPEGATGEEAAAWQDDDDEEDSILSEEFRDRYEQASLDLCEQSWHTNKVVKAAYKTRESKEAFFRKNGVLKRKKDSDSK